MLILSRRTIKKLCRKTDFRPQRQSGQNFLISRKIIAEMIKASNLMPEDEVLEIGPGFGFLTGEIAKIAKRVIAVELDKRLANYLFKNFAGQNNVKIINADIFSLNLADYLKDLDYKLISNLPYNITSLVFRNFLSQKPRPKKMIVTSQREVAERITVAGGKTSILSLITRFYCQPKILMRVGRENFWPEPEVGSSLLRLEKIGYYKFNIPAPFFVKVVKVGFAAKRKTLVNNFKNGLKISAKISQKFFNELKLRPDIRAEDISFEQWLELARRLFDNRGQI